MTRKRRQLSGSFKAKVALAALKGETTMAELSSKHAVHSNQVSAWKKQLLDGAESLFTDGRSRGAAREKAIGRRSVVRTDWPLEDGSRVVEKKSCRVRVNSSDP